MSERSEVTRTNQGRETRIPAYLELASELEAKIRSGALPPGSQLPPQRDLARERSLNVSTVTRAYRELQNLNLVMGSTRRGTIVMGDGAMPRVDRAANPAGIIDLTVNRPPSTISSSASPNPCQTFHRTGASARCRSISRRKVLPGRATPRENGYRSTASIRPKTISSSPAAPSMLCWR